jgi:hypothetical protein
MNTSKENGLKRRLFARVAIGVAALAIGVIAVACEQGGEGDRCNPDLSHDECNAGLTCTQPVNCPENYCCPTNGSSTDPFCQPGCNGGLAAICTVDPDAAACQEDAGTDSASDTGADSASDTGTDSGTDSAPDAINDAPTGG